MSERKRPQPAVYVMESDSGVKVGVSLDVEGRRRELERASGCHIRVMRVFPVSSRSKALVLEAWAHWHLRHDRTIGEWFSCHPIRACDVVADVVRDDPKHRPIPDLIRALRDRAWTTRTPA